MNIILNKQNQIAAELHPNDSIDFNSAIPFYYQLQQKLEVRINSGEWEPGQKLPSESNLCDHFGVSRTVVRQALNGLASNNLIETQKGRGSFVATPKHTWQLMQSLSGFQENTIAQGQTIRTQVLALEIVSATGEIGEYLKLDVGAPVIMLKRLRFVDEEPIVVVTTYLPESLCPNLVDEDFTRQSLYDVLAAKYDLVISEGIRSIEAVNASAELAEQLQLEDGAALSLLKSIGWLEDGTPLEYYVAWHRGDRSRFQVRLVADRKGF